MFNECFLPTPYLCVGQINVYKAIIVNSIIVHSMLNNFCIVNLRFNSKHPTQPISHIMVIYIYISTYLRFSILLLVRPVSWSLCPPALRKSLLHTNLFQIHDCLVFCPAVALMVRNVRSVREPVRDCPNNA